MNYEVHTTMISTIGRDSDNEIEQSEYLNTGEHDNSEINIHKITLQNGLGSMRKRKQETVLRTARYKVHNNPENTITQKFCCITHGLMKRKS